MAELPPPTMLDSFCGPHHKGDLLLVDGNMGTGIISKYSLEMLTPTKYNIGVNLDFIGKSDDIVKVRQRAQKCMDFLIMGQG